LQNSKKCVFAGGLAHHETPWNTLVTNSNPVTSTIKKALKTQRFRAFFFAIDP
jgi:hypothetical protein